MAYVYYAKTIGNAYQTLSGQQLGWKLIPHVKADRKDQPYYRYEFHGSSNVFAGLQSGGAFWQERAPSHLYPGTVSNNSFTFTGEAVGAYNRAYGKFKEKVYTQAANLTAISERVKTIDMMVARLAQLHKGAKALRKGRFKEFLGVFGIKPKPKHVHKTKSRVQDFGALWLEYWMGWAPTAGDVFTTLEFLGEEIPTEPVRAGSTAPYNGFHTVSSSGEKATSSWAGKVSVHLKAKVEVTNPTLFNLNGLGLINPLLTAWQTTPFSWLLGWFVNMEQVIGQLTDWVGLKLKDLVISCKTVASCSYVYTKASTNTLITRSREFVGFSRKVGGVLPPVKPVFRLPNGLSITRGATLASLLVTMFLPTKKV